MDLDTAIASLDAGQKKNYGTLFAIGVAFVAILVLAINTLSSSILTNTPFVVGLIVLLAVVLVGSTISGILSAVGEAKLAQLKLGYANSLTAQKAAAASAERLALLANDKFDEVLTKVGSQKLGTYTYSFYVKRDT